MVNNRLSIEKLYFVRFRRIHPARKFIYKLSRTMHLDEQQMAATDEYNIVFIH